jgi:hypothetical protein
MSWWKHMLGIKSDEEIRAEVDDEPTIKDARKHLERADRVLEELQALESPPPRRPVRAKHVHG